MEKNEIIKICASCFCFNEQKQILLIEHRKFGRWIQPGGHIMEGEELFQSAAREVWEETGIHVEIDDKNPFAVEEYNTVVGKQIDHQFVGRALDTNLKNNDESANCGWFDINELNKLDAVPDLEQKVNQALKILNAGEKSRCKIR